jgi:hypothetical protein
MTSWRDGALGALRMGLLHGAYCLGCCWLLFAVLFPLGLMNVAAMAAVTALIFAEKTLPRGWRAARAAAVLLTAYGAVVIAVPRALPTYSVGGEVAAPAGVGTLMPMRGAGGAAPPSSAP